MKTVLLIGMCVLMLVCQAQAGVVANHSGSADPETEGWEKDFYNIDPYYAYTSALSPDTGYGVDAWQIDCGSGGSSIGGKGMYQISDGGGWGPGWNGVGADPWNDGFALSANVRMVYDKDPVLNGSFMVGIRGDAQYQLRLQAVAKPGQGDFDGTNGDLQLRIYFSGGLTSWETIGDQQAYHKIDLVYDAGAGSADIYIDDSSVALQNDLSPAADGWDGGRVYFGQPDNGDGARGTTNFNSVYLNVVPEPAAMIMLGLGGLALIRRRRA